MKKILLYSAAILTMSLTSCWGDDAPDYFVPTTHGVYVLNEGVWGADNSNLSYIDLYTGNINNGKKQLGDTGQDILIYGSKMYVTVSESKTIEVMDKFTCETLKSIKLSGTQKPRYFVTNGNKIYVSLYDGHVARIDTANLEIEAVTAVGPNPEQMAIANGKLYVANSGGEQYMTGYNNTVSVVNLESFTEETTIPVAANPINMCADQFNDVYVISLSVYGEPGILQRISPDGNVTVLPQGANIMVRNGLYLYLINNPYGSATREYVVLDTKSEKIINTNFLKDPSVIDTPYSLGIDPITYYIYIGQSNKNYTGKGKVFVFDNNGNYISTLDAGVSPRNFGFLNNL